MAWRSSGTNNAEMVDKLTRFGVITSDHVQRAFRRVDRKFFVPRGNESMAHSDQPLKEGNVHISAPHIYASAMEALDLVPNSSMSFLNIGSGTGYISCIVAEILGPNSLHYGVELHEDVIEHCKSSIAKWKTNGVEESGHVSIFHFMDTTPKIHIVKGNGLNIDREKGESVAGFDRIYVGASVDKEAFRNIVKLLSPGGILVGPVDDELVKVARVGNISIELEDDMTASRMDEEFTSQVLSGVRFAPLVRNPFIPTVLPPHVWDPSLQRFYPSEHQRASIEIMMCSNSQVMQPLPPVPSPNERVNAAAMLPRSVWVEILSYTHRKWFEPEENEVVYLRRRLREEKAKTARAEKARREAEERCNAAEREKAVHRMLARRWHNRLNGFLVAQQDQGRQQQDHHAVSNPAVAMGVLEDVLVSFLDRREGGLAGLRLMLQQQLGEDDIRDDDGDDNVESDREEEEGENEVEDMDHDMEEDDIESEEDIEHQEEEDDDFLEFFDSNSESESEVLSVAEVETAPVAASLSSVESLIADNDSVMMEVSGSTKIRAHDQPRTVSISSADL
eukprot:CCRYP_001323-RA/>CCRYP_001323-RA protein AED:0.13 eAED:0.13 QI:294/1/1/1/1/1/6/111/561